MFYTTWNTTNYSRPIAYRSYYPRVHKKEVISSIEPETNEVIALLQNCGIKYDNLGGLSRGVRFEDFEVGKRHFNFNGYHLRD